MKGTPILDGPTWTRVVEAAKADHTTASEWLRTAINDALNRTDNHE